MKKNGKTHGKNGNGAFSSFVKIALRLGFFDATSAHKAQELVAADPAHPTQDILVGAGLLTAKQASDVADLRKLEDMGSHLDDKFKRAARAASGATDAAMRLNEVCRK